MRCYRGAEHVAEGLYFNTRQLSFASISRGEYLPGASEDKYIRVPVLALLIVGPFMGAAYVIFLPMIGFVLFLMFVLKKLAISCDNLAQGLARVLHPVWEPMTAYLHRGKSRKRIHEKKTSSNSQTEDPWLQDVKSRLKKKDDNS